MKSQILMEFVLGAAKALLVGDLQLERDYITFEERLKSEGLSFATKTLPKWGKIFDRALGDGCYDNSLFPCFRKAKNCATPRFLGALTSLVFDEQGVLRSDASALAVKHIRQVSYMFYKMDVPFEDAQIEGVISSFRENEEELKGIDWGHLFEVSPVINLAAMICRKNFDSLDVISRLRPSHGPGVVANAASIDKLTTRLHPGSPSYSLFGRFFWFNPEHSFSELERFPVWDHFSYFHDADLRAKIILVPKDSRGPRLISCEPMEHMYIQQGIMKRLVRFIEHENPLTRGSVFFSSNEEHRRLAVEASVNQEWSTLDLKDASDRVSWPLVQFMFGGTTLLSALSSTRTKRTEYKGEVFELAKFAPMGSALCFPVLSVVVFLLVYSGIVLSGVSPDKAKAAIRVFGDDIIVRTEYARIAIDALTAAGLKVNRDKSFINSKFAESCGADAFCGMIVTPHRLRKVWNLPEEIQKRRPGSTAYHLCALANQVSPSYTNLRQHLFVYVERICGGSLPYGLDLSYLCRVCQPDDLVVLLNEYLDRRRAPRNTRHMAVWKVVSKETPFRETSWVRLQRTHGLLGKDLLLPSWGSTTLPRNSSVVKRRVRIPCVRL